MLLGGSVQTDTDLTQGSKALNLLPLKAAHFQACQYDGCRLESFASWEVTPRLHALHPEHSLGILCCVATINRVLDLQTQRLHACSLCVCRRKTLFMATIYTTATNPKTVFVAMHLPAQTLHHG